LFCIVTGQSRFSSDRQSKKRERFIERTEGESVFQREGPIEAKDQDRAIEVLLCRTKRSSLLEERSEWWEEG